MKTLLALLATFAAGAFCAARADLTLAENVEGDVHTTVMTVKIKGDKARIDASPQMTTILDVKSGETLHLINNRQVFLRMSGDKLRAALELMNRGGDKSSDNIKPKLIATGRKATINGYETEEYVYETPRLKAAIWIAKKYPNAPSILKQLQILSSGPWKMQNGFTPDYSDFPGVPLKFVMTMDGKDITTTVTSLKEGELSDSEFSVPTGYEEIKEKGFGLPESRTMKESLPAVSPKP